MTIGPKEQQRRDMRERDPERVAGFAVKPKDARLKEAKAAIVESTKPLPTRLRPRGGEAKKPPADVGAEASGPVATKGFDKKSYQRDLMRKRRAADKAKKGNPDA